MDNQDSPNLNSIKLRNEKLTEEEANKPSVVQNNNKKISINREHLQKMAKIKKSTTLKISKKAREEVHRHSMPLNVHNSNNINNINVNPFVSNPFVGLDPATA